MFILSFPQKCVLLEWSEQQQAFFINDVQDGKPHSQINVNGVLIVHICKNYREAHLLIEYLEKYMLNKRSTKNKRISNTYQIIRQIKAITKFATKYCRTNDIKTR